MGWSRDLGRSLIGIVRKAGYWLGIPASLMAYLPIYFTILKVIEIGIKQVLREKFNEIGMEIGRNNHVR